MKKFILIISILIFGSSLTACSTQDNNTHLEEGMRLESNFEYSKALVEYKKHLNLNPDDIIAYEKSADILILKGNYDESIELLNKGLAENDNSFDILLKIAEVYNLKGDYSEALTFFNRVLASNTNNQEAIIGKMVAHSRLSQLDELDQYISERSEILDSKEVEILKGFGSIDSIDVASEFINKAYELSFEDEEILQIKDTFDKNKGQEKLDIESKIDIAREIINYGKPTFAIPIVDSTIRENRFFEGGYLYKGIIQNIIGEYENSEKNLSTSIAYNSEISESYHYLAITQVNLEKFEDANENFIKAISLAGEQSESIYRDYLEYARIINDLELQGRLITEINKISEDKLLFELGEVYCLQKDQESLSEMKTNEELSELDRKVLEACDLKLSEDFEQAKLVIIESINQSPGIIFSHYLNYKISDELGNVDELDQLYLRLQDIDINKRYISQISK